MSVRVACRLPSFMAAAFAACCLTAVIWATASYAQSRSRLSPATASGASALRLVPVSLARNDCLRCDPPVLPESIAKRFPGVVLGTYKICIASNGKVESVEPRIGVTSADDTVLSALRTWSFRPQRHASCFLQSFVFRALSLPHGPQDGGVVPDSVDPSLEMVFQRASEECLTERQKGAGDQALLSCHRAESVAVAVFGGEHQHVAAALGCLVMVYTARELHADAEALLPHALAIWEKIPPGGDRQKAQYLSSLSDGYFHQRHYVLAEALSRRVLQLAERMPELEPVKLMDYMDTLVVIYERQERYAPMEQVLKREIDLLRWRAVPRWSSWSSWSR